jgi:hypothetical protein
LKDEEKNSASTPGSRQPARRQHSEIAWTTLRGQVGFQDEERSLNHLDPLIIAIPLKNGGLTNDDRPRNYLEITQKTRENAVLNS